jgi:hypothetical protein
LYGCETLYLTLREVYRLRVFDKRVLRKIFRLKREEVVEGCRRQQKGKFLACTLQIKMDERSVACMGKMRSA